MISYVYIIIYRRVKDGEYKSKKNTSDRRVENLKSYTKITKESWSICETVVMRYPEQKKEYEELRESILKSSSCPDGQPRSNYRGSHLEQMVIKLSSNRMIRMEKENRVVENAYNKLDEEQKKLIRKRYWNETGKKIPYLKIHDVAMSERTMKRTVFGFLYLIAKALGEVD